MTEKLLTESGAISLASIFGGALGALIAEPTLGVILGGALALLGVLLRCATEIWKTARRDRERITRLKLRLEAHNLPTETETED